MHVEAEVDFWTRWQIGIKGYPYLTLFAHHKYWPWSDTHVDAMDFFVLRPLSLINHHTIWHCNDFCCCADRLLLMFVLNVNWWNYDDNGLPVFLCGWQLHLRRLLWMYGPAHLGVRGDNRADGLAVKANHHKWFASRKLWSVEELEKLPAGTKPRPLTASTDRRRKTRKEESIDDLSWRVSKGHSQSDDH